MEEDDDLPLIHDQICATHTHRALYDDCLICWMSLFYKRGTRGLTSKRSSSLCLERMECEYFGGGDVVCYINKKVKVLVTQLCPTLCDPEEHSHQTPLSMGFSRQEYCSGLPFPSPYINKSSC